MEANNNLFHDVSIRIVKFFNILLMMIPFVVVWYIAYADTLFVSFSRRGHWLVILLFVAIYFFIGRVYDAFNVSYNSVSEMIYSQVLSCCETDAIMYVVTWLLVRHTPNALPLVLVFFTQVLFAVIWSFTSQAWYFKTFPANKTVVVYGEVRRGVSNLIDEFKLKKKYKVVATISAEECISDYASIDDADTIFLIGVHSRERNIIAKHCLMNNIKAFVVPRVGDLVVMSSKRMHMFHLLLLKIERYDPPFEYALVKRIGDVVLSLIALGVFLPIIIITAICIKMEDRGPIIYKQCRLTKNGKKFNIYKFRSMKIDAEQDGVARLSTGENDDRITKVGKIIRKVRIDELPQLFNILKGDLAIVGPRAERPELAYKYQEKMPEFALRLQTKAGLTGYAQVYGKYNTTPYNKLLMDLMYIANASILEDVRIIFATIKILFLPESTEGVAAGQTTAMDYENAAVSTENEAETVANRTG